MDKNGLTKNSTRKFFFVKVLSTTTISSTTTSREIARIIFSTKAASAFVSNHRLLSFICRERCRQKQLYMLFNNAVLTFEQMLRLRECIFHFIMFRCFVSGCGSGVFSLVLWRFALNLNKKKTCLFKFLLMFVLYTQCF